MVSSLLSRRRFKATVVGQLRMKIFWHCCEMYLRSREPLTDLPTKGKITQRRNQKRSSNRKRRRFKQRPCKVILLREQLRATNCHLGSEPDNRSRHQQRTWKWSLRHLSLQRYKLKPSWEPVVVLSLPHLQHTRVIEAELQWTRNSWLC